MDNKFDQRKFSFSMFKLYTWIRNLTNENLVLAYKQKKKMYTKQKNPIKVNKLFLYLVKICQQQCPYIISYFD